MNTAKKIGISLAIIICVSLVITTFVLIGIDIVINGSLNNF